MNKSLSILPVEVEDFPALVVLINQAYRGDGITTGWTTESHLLKGSSRTDLNALTELNNIPGTCLLKCSMSDGTIIGFVCLQKEQFTIHLGMLSVSIHHQGVGIGKLLIDASKNYARMQGCDTITIEVISVRDELIAWYERHGFIRTGETLPFPTDNRFGTPIQPLEFAVLVKNISQETEIRGTKTGPVA